MKPAAQVPVFTVRQWIKLGKQIGVLRTGKKRKRTWTVMEAQEEMNFMAREMVDNMSGITDCMKGVNT
jgi:hypothetical protein